MRLRSRSMAFGAIVLFILITGVNVAQDGRRVVLAPESDRYSVYSGAVHVHSVHSDGSGTLEDIGKVAADHNVSRLNPDGSGLIDNNGALVNGFFGSY